MKYQFVDVPEEIFPFTVEYLNQNGDTIETAVVAGPGVLDIPKLAETHGPITVRVTYPNGETFTAGPPGENDGQAHQQQQLDQ